MKRSLCRLLVVLTAASCAASSTLPAFAQSKPTADAKAEARSRFDGGLTLFEEGNNAAALAEFQRAYDLIPNPVVLFNIGLVYAAMNRPAESAEALQKVVSEPKGLSPDVLSRANQTLSQQLGRIAEIALTCNVPATIEVDNVEAAKAPLTGPMKVAGGTHIIGAIAPGYTPQRKQVTVAGGAKTNVEFTLSPMEGRLAHLTLKSRIPGANVMLDGELVGHTPLMSSLTLMPGNHKVELVRPGYRTARTELTLGDGATGEVTLEPEEDRTEIGRTGGDLKLAITETDALVTLNGTPRGPYTSSLRLAPGPHHLLVERGGFRPNERDVDVSSGQTTVVPIVLDPTPEMRELYVGRARSQRTWSWITIGAGVLIAGGGAGLLAYNASARQDARSDLDAGLAKLQRKEGVCNTGGLEGDVDACNAPILDAQDRIDASKQRDIIGYVGIGVGAAATGLGLYFLLSGDSPTKYDRKPATDVVGGLTPRFAVGPNGGSLAVRGVF
ncbi:MAG: PEGA domain-containing protein [Polyangiaceae bacterium]